MSSGGIPGLNSPYTSDEFIQGLMKPEKLKLENMEEDLSTLSEQKGYWQDLGRYVGDLRTASRGLFSFENPFNNKAVESSNERLLRASATRQAKEQELNLTVLRTATADKFISPSLPSDTQVPSGNYTLEVSSETVTFRYRGGSLADFASRLEERSNGLLKTSVVRDSPDTQLILFESTKTGKDSRIDFQGEALNWALENEIVAPVEGKNEVIPLGQAEATLEPGDSYQWTPPEGIKIDPAMTLEYTITIRDVPPKEVPQEAPESPTLPGTSSALFQDVEVMSFGSRVDIPEGIDTPLGEVPERRDDTLGYYTTSSGEQQLPPLPSELGAMNVRVPLGEEQGDFLSLNLGNNNTHRELSITNIRLVPPLSGEREYEPTNSLSEGQDALLDFNGIQITRPTNQVDDLIPGLALELRRPDPNEVVNLKVVPNIEGAKEAVIGFVVYYNQVIRELLILSSDNGEIINEVSFFDDQERERAFERLGAMQGDTSLTQIKSRMQRIVSEPYPTSLERELSLLSQIGVSTNASAQRDAGSVDITRLRGYLEINEEILDQALATKGDAIKELFGQDSDGDLVVDSGIAYALDNFLKPYTQLGGIFANKISLVDSQIDRANDEIDDYKEFLVEYEAKLRSQYAQVDAAMNQLESSSNSLNIFNQNNKQ